MPKVKLPAKLIVILPDRKDFLGDDMDYKELAYEVEVLVARVNNNLRDLAKVEVFQSSDDYESKKNPAFMADLRGQSESMSGACAPTGASKPRESERKS